MPYNIAIIIHLLYSYIYMTILFIVYMLPCNIITQYCSLIIIIFYVVTLKCRFARPRLVVGCIGTIIIGRFSEHLSCN